VRIDTIVSPTIAGIRDGKDEILLAALDCLTQVEETSSEAFGIAVYPNPASWQLAVASQQSAVNGQRSAVKLSIVDLYGREIKAFGNISSFPYQIDISDLVDGVYLLRVMDEDGKSGMAKFLKIAE
jgi:hypothetical protein